MMTHQFSYSTKQVRRLSSLTNSLSSASSLSSCTATTASTTTSLSVTAQPPSLPASSLSLSSSSNSRCWQEGNEEAEEIEGEDEAQAGAELKEDRPWRQLPDPKGSKAEEAIEEKAPASASPSAGQQLPRRKVETATPPAKP